MKLTLLSAPIVAGLIGLLSINAFAADQTIGALTAELPVEVETNKSFDFDVRLKPAGDFKGTVKVAMQQNPNVDYQPRTFSLSPGQTQTVTATVRKSNSGLAIIYASADNWQPIDTAIVVGGAPIQLNAKIEQPVESYRRKSFIVSFTDEAGKPVRLEAGAKMLLELSNLLISQNGKDWLSEITLPLDKEDDETKPLQLKATSWYADNGIIKMNLTTGQGYKIKSSSVNVAIVPPWWVLMMMGMLGGLMYSMIQFLRTVLQSRRKRSTAAWAKKVSLAVLLGIVPGALAYLLAAWNILGIKTDTTNLKGFFILGLMFAYVGMDVVLALTAPKKAKTT
jgi:hypothetical protein